jgi:hypothetical protein
MRQALKLHPDSRCHSVRRIEVDVARPAPSTLALGYFLFGKIGDVRIPAATTPARRNKLWEHSCFEAFVRAGSRQSYYEFNFAPSLEWAIYAFSGYRSGMNDPVLGPPQMERRSNEDCLELRVSLQLESVADLPDDLSWHLGLSAVVEELSGCKSYWALAHPSGPPDFHHSDCFALELPPAA